MKISTLLVAFSFITGISISSDFMQSDFKVHLIDSNTLQKELVSELQHLEKQFIYPFSATEEFTIKHGLNGDYLAFFKSLGKPYYYIVRSNKNKEIAAAVCCVLREMPTFNGKIKKAWYVCDLKVSQNYQGQHLPFFIAKKIALWRYLQCSRGFAICMNPAEGDPKSGFYC